MSGGEACRQIEESAWEAGPPPIPELDAESPVPESATRLRRASADTMPTSEPFTEARSERPDWAVDLGEVMVSMTTFELWSAIEHREVAPWVRVWREGLECWTPVGELPELGWAVASTPEPPREATPEPALADAELEPIAQPAATPAPPPGPRPIAAELPVVSRQASQPPMQAPVAPAPREGTRWLFAGSAVAAIAIAAAIFRITAPAALTPTAPAGAGAPAAPAEARPTPIATSPVKRAATPVVRREDRGQRRLPRGGRRAHGR